MTTRLFARSLAALGLALLAFAAVPPAAAYTCVQPTICVEPLAGSSGVCVITGAGTSERTWTCAGPDGVCSRVYHAAEGFTWNEACVVKLYGSGQGVYCQSSSSDADATCVVPV